MFYSVFAKTAINNPTKFYSIYPPLACITRSSLHLKLSTALCRVSWCILTHAFLRERFNASTKSWDETQASASKMDRTQQFIGFKSGDECGQTPLLQKQGKWFLHHSWVLLDVCDGAASCWSVNDFCLKCFLSSARVGVKIVSMYELALSLASCETKWEETSMFWKQRATPWPMTVSGAWKTDSKDTIILSVKHCFAIEHIFIWENDLSCVCNWLHF